MHNKHRSTLPRSTIAIRQATHRSSLRPPANDGSIDQTVVHRLGVSNVEISDVKVSVSIEYCWCRLPALPIRLQQPKPGHSDSPFCRVMIDLTDERGLKRLHKS